MQTSRKRMLAHLVRAIIELRPRLSFLPRGGNPKLHATRRHFRAPARRRSPNRRPKL